MRPASRLNLIECLAQRGSDNHLTRADFVGIEERSGVLDRAAL